MRDPTTGSDEAFFKLLRDFSSTYQGKDVSTEDFVRYADKYMTHSIDLEHNHRLDWFFNEWVYETGVPTYNCSTAIRNSPRRNSWSRGTITQSGVQATSKCWCLVAEMGKDKKVSLGRVHRQRGGGRFKFTAEERPKRLAIDEDNLLAIVD